MYTYKKFKLVKQKTYIACCLSFKTQVFFKLYKQNTYMTTEIYMSILS